MYEAGVWWRETLHALHRLIGAPIPYPRSPAWEMVARGSVGDYVEDLSEIVDLETRAEVEADLRRRKARLMRDYADGRAVMGECMSAVEALVVHDRAERLEMVRTGLQALAVLRESRTSKSWTQKKYA
jgi:hypothetical protein